MPVVIISGHGNIETAVSAIKRGAYDYIEKPFNADRLLLVVGRALETTRLKRENEELKGRSGLDTELVGNSLAIRNLRQTPEKNCAHQQPRVGHRALWAPARNWWRAPCTPCRQRANGPFVALSAATMDPERLEERLFGVEQDRIVPRALVHLKKHMAAHFTSMKLPTCRLRRRPRSCACLLEQTFQRVGGTKKTKVDVRIISSTCARPAGS